MKQATHFKQQPYRRPVIGVPSWIDQSTAYGGVLLYAINQSYINILTAAGAIPFVIPLNLDEEQLWDLFEQLDGLFLSGGTDIDPTFYGEATTGTEGGFDAVRDESELRLARWALETDMPLFGVCRGMQIINVAAGGTLVHDLATDLPQADKHDFFAAGAERAFIRHQVYLDPYSYLGRVLGRSTGVNSMHHQVVNRVGRGLSVTAWSADGLVEGIEGNDQSFVVGVQWHPEELTADPTQAQLFIDFIAAAAGERLPLAI